MKVSYSFTSFGDMALMEGNMNVTPSEIRSMSDEDLCRLYVSATLFHEGCCPDLDMDCEIEVTETILGE